MDYHKGKWLIHGTNQLQTLELPCRISQLRIELDIKSDGNMLMGINIAIIIMKYDTNETFCTISFKLCYLIARYQGLLCIFYCAKYSAP